MTEETEEFIKAANMMPTDFAHHAAAHFLKAVRKHPRFADRLFVETDKADAEASVEGERSEIAYLEKYGWLDAKILALCELDEAHFAHVQGDAAATVDELYDAVAVLMRMISVVEGKQALGGKEGAE